MVGVVPSRRRLARGLLLCLLLPLLLTHCDAWRTSQVTLRADPVQDTTATTLARSLRVFEVAAAASARFLTQGYTAGTVPASALETYTTDLGPTFQAALEQARDALITYLDTQHQDDYEQLLAAMDALTRLMEEVTELAQTHGWGDGV